MSVYPELPFEFVVIGTPISLQAKRSSIADWKRRVNEYARAALPAGSWLLDVPLALTVYIFPASELSGDLDNRLKPILDAMTRCVYEDDEQIERIVIQKFEPDNVFAFRSPSGVLARALEASEPVVYIRLTGDPHEELV